MGVGGSELRMSGSGVNNEWKWVVVDGSGLEWAAAWFSITHH